MDRPVGTHSKTGREVYQCAKTNLLFYYNDPTRRYISPREVVLEPAPCKPEKKKK